MKFKKFTAITYNGQFFGKYRNVYNNEQSIKTFENYCKQKNIVYINYYCSKTRDFYKRQYITQDKK